VSINGDRIIRSNGRHLYWTFAQQLAHVVANGATARPGDLLGTGTISGPERASVGSLMELTWRGRDPVVLGDGTSRTFLEDGDCVRFTAWCGEGEARIGFGECAGTVLPALTG
jgi:fumarylacetoacetase